MEMKETLCETRILYTKSIKVIFHVYTTVILLSTKRIICQCTQSQQKKQIANTCIQHEGARLHRATTVILCIEYNKLNCSSSPEYKFSWLPMTQVLLRSKLSRSNKRIGTLSDLPRTHELILIAACGVFWSNRATVADFYCEGVGEEVRVPDRSGEGGRILNTVRQLQFQSWGTWAVRSALEFSCFAQFFPLFFILYMYYEKLFYFL